jgi:cytochrome c-type biogenesis protein CcmH/NrfG
VLAGIILGAAAVVAALMLFQIGHSVRKQDRYRTPLALAGLAIAGAIVAVVVTIAGDEGPGDSPRLAGVRVQELARVSSSFTGPSPALRQVQAAKQVEAGKVAPVPSLISGLEKRLEAAPDDAGGWALLAQSYAFIGRTDEAESALSRAVELGADESDLRGRVSSARRDPHAGVPGAPALD